MSVETELFAAVEGGALRHADLHLARTLAALEAHDCPELLLAAALVSARTGEGHVCVDLGEVAGRSPFGDDAPGLAAPGLGPWREALGRCRVVGAPGDDTPLVLDADGRLYLGRYWHFEATIAARLRALAVDAGADGDAAWLRARLAHYFPAVDAEPDMQKAAAATALLRRLTVISGGPGTGKTTTVTKLLALLLEAGRVQPTRVELVAPTGKAAARLTESIAAARERLECTAAIRDALALEASTIHRLLGAVPGRVGFRHDADNPLHVDVLVVDEASMVDVPLMARLLQALPDSARLILLGDKDQLASVEAGSVLGDICNRGEPLAPTPTFRARLEALDAAPPPTGAEPQGPLSDSLVVLTRSYRFGGDSGIGNLARAVNRGDAAAALAVCRDPRFDDVAWVETGLPQLAAQVAAVAVEQYAGYRRSDAPAEALERFGTFRFLCALREGPFGVTAVNALVETALRRAGLISGGDLYYPGRPILVTRNDYSVKLFNGDIGLVLPDAAADGNLRAFFPDGEGGVRRVLLNRLPPHETVFAMTVHKSQGSEFDRCTVVLPDVPSPVLTRELVYTAITRGKRQVTLWGGQTEFENAITRRVERASGLRDALYQRAGSRG